MAEDDASVYLVLIIAVVAVIGLALSVASFATDQSMTSMMGGRGMMSGNGGVQSSTPGALEWTVLILSVVLLAVAVVLLLRGRARPATSGAGSPSRPLVPVPPVPPRTAVVPAIENKAGAFVPAPSEPVPEPALVKLLDEDERRMYLELRDHGGEMLQRDLVALGIFSKAKVTRVLDKLESKGVVVREAHGMTNRVRLVGAESR